MRLQQLWGWLRTIFHATKENNIANASRFRNAELELQQAYHDQYLATQSYYEYLAQKRRASKSASPIQQLFGLESTYLKQQRNSIWNFLRAALRGQPDAQYYLGICHLKGRLGLNKNDIQARKWLQRAANQGHEQAQLTLAQYLA